MSSINPNNINGQYPIAGQDNDSQGFRDNFTNIKNNFTFSKSEIEDLQNNAILKSPLAGGIINNDLSYNELISARLRNAVETIYSIGTVSTDLAIDWTDGHFQKFTLSGTNITVTIDKTTWPTSGYYTKFKLQITVGSTNRVVTLSTAGVTYLGLDSIQGNTGASSNIFNLAANTVYLFEFSTHDKGDTVTVCDLLRNRDTGTFTDITVNGNLTIGATVVNSNYQYSNSASTGGNIDVSATTNRVILNPASGFDSFYINLPAGNVDAKTIQISSTETLTNVVINGNSGTIVKPSANVTLTAGTRVEYFYHATAGTWYKVA
jgi:hypothetical protein